MWNNKRDLVESLWKTIWYYLVKVKLCLCHDPIDPSLGIFLREIYIFVSEICASIFIVICLQLKRKLETKIFTMKMDKYGIYKEWNINGNE